MKKLFLLLFFILPCGLCFAQSDADIYVNFKGDTIQPAGYLGRGEIYETPYYIIKGRGEGPVMLIDGCLHGDEIASREACLNIIKNIQVEKGTLILVPTVNMPAYKEGRRSLPDTSSAGLNRDLNRRFPGIIPHSDCGDGYPYYECKLAGDYIDKLVITYKPQLVLNLHESVSYDVVNKDRRYKTLEQMKYLNYGNTIISCVYDTVSAQYRKDSVNLCRVKEKINSEVSSPYYDFNIVYYRNKSEDGYLLDYVVKEFPGTLSYTIETYRNFNYEDEVYFSNYKTKIRDTQFSKERAFEKGFNIIDRVNLQLLCVTKFMDLIKLGYKYHGGDLYDNGKIKLSTPVPFQDNTITKKKDENGVDVEPNDIDFPRK